MAPITLKRITGTKCFVMASFSLVKFDFILKFGQYPWVQMCKSVSARDVRIYLTFTDLKCFNEFQISHNFAEDFLQITVDLMPHIHS